MLMILTHNDLANIFFSVDEIGGVVCNVLKNTFGNNIGNGVSHVSPS